MEPVGFLNSDDVELPFIYMGHVGYVLQQPCGPCPEVLDPSWFTAALGTSEVKRHSRSHGHWLLTFGCGHLLLLMGLESMVFNEGMELLAWLVTFSFISAKEMSSMLSSP